MKVSEPTVERIVQYHRILRQLQEEDQRVVSSQQIAEILKIKASQVRKDLSYFGEIGKRGVGYHVKRLYKHIADILASPKSWNLGLVGLGSLGQALTRYPPFRSSKYHIEAVFDNDPAKIGRDYGGLHCFHSDEMPRILKEKNIEVLVLTVPPDAAQDCVNKAYKSGVLKGILSFSPTSLVVPKPVLLYTMDISVEMEKLLFYLKENGRSDE